MTDEDIYKIIRPHMEHCGCDQDAMAAARAILPEIERLRAALKAIADDPDTNVEATAYARNTLAYEQEATDVTVEHSTYTEWRDL